MSTTLLIGRWPAAIRRAFSHGGDGPIVTSSKARAVKRGHRSGASTTTSTPAIVAGACPGPRPTAAAPAARRWRRGPRARRRRRARQSGRLGVTSSSSTSVAIGSTPASGVPGLELVVEDHDPRVLGADRELVLGQDHPVGLHAAQLGHAELGAVGHHRARARDGDGLPRGDVGRAADDLLRAAVADVDHAHLQAVGVGVPAGLEHRADDEALERVDAVVVDAPRPWCRSSSGAPRARATGRPGSQYSLQPFDGTRIIRTAPGSAGRSRRTGAGRGRRA